MPITRRTLKKRSKQAVPILVRHYGAPPEAFRPAPRGEAYHGSVIRCTHGSGDPAVVEGRPNCDCSNYALPGTPMVGRALTGFQCRGDGDPQSALEALQDVVAWGEQPETMTDADWARTIRIARVRPYDAAEFAAFMARTESNR